MLLLDSLEPARPEYLALAEWTPPGRPLALLLILGGIGLALLGAAAWAVVRWVRRAR